MDFGSLLNVAQKNEKTPKKEIKYYSTKFEPPKKEERSSKQLSNNIKKFLARKEEEEKQKVAEAKVKREELLSLRSQDKKATRRVSVMLKRTKSANKSVIQDAVDNDNTAVTLVGPSQPDEDDYGYVSQEASAFYNKMMAKYNNIPDEPKFSTSTKKSISTNLNGTKDRVRAALLKEQEEAMLPHRRKRKSKIVNDDSSETSDSKSYTSYTDSAPEKPISKPKPKPSNAPPPLNFQELLKIAEKKQFEPIKIEPKKKSEEDEHPMTKKQKREYEKEKAWKEHRERRMLAMEGGNIKPTTDSSMPPPIKIPKLNNGTSMKIPKTSNAEDRSKTSQKPIPGSRNPIKNGHISSERKPDTKVSKLRSELEKPRDSPKSVPNRPQSSFQSSNRTPERPPSKSTPKATDKNIMRKDIGNKILNKSRASLPDIMKSNKRDIKVDKVGSMDGKPKQFPPSDVRPKQFPPADVRPKQFPPADVKPKQFPPGDVRGRFPSKDVKRKPPMGHKRRILDDDDSEYDSEMDDFIDDDNDCEDYSKHISEIFGYDKRKYRDRDEDDHTMESSFSQMMKEEFISSKIGLMEDLEDMKQEALEKKQKAIRKKTMK